MMRMLGKDSFLFEKSVQRGGEENEKSSEMKRNILVRLVIENYDQESL